LTMALRRLVTRALPTTRVQTPALAARLSTHMETDEYIIYPREKPGLDYSLNWSLNKNGVTPSNDAFRITKSSQAAKLGSAIAVSGPSKSAPEAGEGLLDFGAFEAAAEAAKEALSEAPTLYVCEGDVPGTRVPCRVITDDATMAATAMTKVLERMPRPKDATELPVTCFLTEKGAGNFEGFIVEQGDGVVYDESAVVADVVLTGTFAKDPAKLWATIKTAAEEIQK